MISTSKLGEIIDLMIEKRVAKITLPDSVEIVMFEPQQNYNLSSVDIPDLPGENEKTDMELLLMSAK